MEKIFDLGKSDTVPKIDVVGRNRRECFCSRARNLNRIFDMHENVDYIRVLDGSENSCRRLSRTHVSASHTVSSRSVVEAKQGGFCGCVHRPLSGVGVFFVALV